MLLSVLEKIFFLGGSGNDSKQIRHRGAYIFRAEKVLAGRKPRK
jgi:hypothetical protein